MRVSKRAAVLSISAIVILILSAVPVVISSGPGALSPVAHAPQVAPSPGASAIVRGLAHIDPALAKAEAGLGSAKLADLQSIVLHSLAPAPVADRIEASAVRTAAVHPLSYSTNGFDIEAIVGLTASLCIIAGPETLGMGCLIGLAIVTAGLLIACAFSLWGVCNSNAPSTIYAPAVALFEQILGQTNDWYNAGSQSLNVTVQNYDSLTNDTVGVWEYEAAAAALSQLGNVSFNPILDLSQSGIATQAADTVFATEYASADDMLTTMLNMAGVFGPSVGAGADGIVCLISPTAKLQYGFNGSTATRVEGGITSSLNTSGGTWGPDGKCQSGITGSSLPNGHFGWGTALPNAPNPYPVAVTNNSSIAWPMLNPLVPAGATGIEAIFSTAATHLSASPRFYVASPATPPTNGYQLDPIPTGIPQGAYFYNGSWGCGNTYSACGTVGTGSGFYGTDVVAIAPDSPAVGTGIIPIGRAVTAANGINHADGGTAYDPQIISNAPQITDLFHSGSAVGQVAIACGPIETGHALGSYIQPQTQASDLPFIPTCPSSVAFQIAEMNALAMDATNVGAAYWAFLTGLGYTNVNQVPVNCVIPPVESFLPPDYNVTALGMLNATVLTGLAQAMLVKLAQTFGTGAPTYCGIHIRAPMNLSFPSQDLIAIGDIYVPGVAGQTFDTPSTWANTSVSIAIAPSTGNLTIPVNKTWEAPGTNPSILLYGNLSGPRNKTTKDQYSLTVKDAGEAFTIVQGQYDHFTGNSSKPNGSVYPHNIYTPYGVGGALYLTTCYVRSGAVWAASTDCNYSIQTIHYNISKDECLLYATNCSVPPFPVTPGLNCGFAPVNEIGQFFVGIPILGSFACLIGWILLFVVAVIVIALVVAFYPRRRASGPSS